LKDLNIKSAKALPKRFKMMHLQRTFCSRSYWSHVCFNICWIIFRQQNLAYGRSVQFRKVDLQFWQCSYCAQQKKIIWFNDISYSRKLRGEHLHSYQSIRAKMLSPPFWFTCGIFSWRSLPSKLAMFTSCPYSQ